MHSTRSCQDPVGPQRRIYFADSPVRPALRTPLTGGRCSSPCSWTARSEASPAAGISLWSHIAEDTRSRADNGDALMGRDGGENPCGVKWQGGTWPGAGNQDIWPCPCA